MSDEIPILSEPRENKLFDYHPKVKEKIEGELLRHQRKLETVAAHDLPDAQAMVKALRLMLELPERVREEEKRKENG